MKGQEVTYQVEMEENKPSELYVFVPKAVYEALKEEVVALRKSEESQIEAVGCHVSLIEDLNAMAANLIETASVVYGYVWMVDGDPGANRPYYSAEAIYAVRSILVDVLTDSQRSHGIMVAEKAIAKQKKYEQENSNWG